MQSETFPKAGRDLLRAGSWHPGPFPGRDVTSRPRARAKLPPVKKRLETVVHFFLTFLFFFFKARIPTAGIQCKQKILCFRSCNLHFTTTSQQAVKAPCSPPPRKASGTRGGTRPVSRWLSPRDRAQLETVALLRGQRRPGESPTPGSPSASATLALARRARGLLLPHPMGEAAPAPAEAQATAPQPPARRDPTRDDAVPSVGSSPGAPGEPPASPGDAPRRGVPQPSGEGTGHTVNTRPTI